MDVKLPHLGEGADSGTVVNLMVKEGDTIAKDQPVLELENEKAVATIPSTAAGVITKVFVKTGDKISAGQLIISVEESGDAAVAPAATAQPKKQAPAKAPAPAVAPTPAEPAEEAHEEAAEVAHSNGDIAAAPSIRKMATDLGIDLGKVRGSARGGRIVLSDVRAYIARLMRAGEQPKAAASAAAPAAAERIDFSKWGEVSKKPLT